MEPANGNDPVKTELLRHQTALLGTSPEQIRWRMKAWRLATGLKQAMVSDLLGWGGGGSKVSKWEILDKKGRCNPPDAMDILAMQAQGMSINVSYVFEGVTTGIAPDITESILKYLQASADKHPF